MQTRNVAKAIAERDFSKAMSLRDPEFSEALDGFYHTSQLVKEPELPVHKVGGFLELRRR
jgi:6-phosphofructokinase 1